MATVYRAHDPRHDRAVAIKVLRADVAGVLARERFAREIAIVARLDHPRILPLYESGAFNRDDGTPVVYYTMPCVTGRSLRDRLDEEPQLPLAEAVAVAREVAAALAHAHAARRGAPRHQAREHPAGRAAASGSPTSASRGRSTRPAASGSPRPAWCWGRRRT